MPIKIGPRHPGIVAAASTLFVIGVMLFVWQFRARADARSIESWSGTISSGATTSTAELPPPPAVTIEYGQAGLVDDLNRYWLEKINALRKEKGLRVLQTEPRLMATAGEWAAEMASRREITHVRLDGKTMHQWIDTKGLSFADRGGDGGWRTNYFVENIARFYAEPTPGDMQRALDEILGWFLDEGPGGDHYESIYHPDWNSVGLGYAFDPAEEHSRAYFVFHYGSLK